MIRSDLWIWQLDHFNLSKSSFNRVVRVNQTALQEVEERGGSDEVGTVSVEATIWTFSSKGGGTGTAAVKNHKVKSLLQTLMFVSLKFVC